MYKIKNKYKAFLAKYAWTKLDINGIYTLDKWIEAGFDKKVLEEVK